jgi:hypothetical protein
MATRTPGPSYEEHLADFVRSAGPADEAGASEVPSYKACIAALASQPESGAGSSLGHRPGASEGSPEPRGAAAARPAMPTSFKLCRRGLEGDSFCCAVVQVNWPAWRG